jgi:Rrf2 family transcriptional regulator, iron-sulfur cluster assembly transcription factor
MNLNKSTRYALYAALEMAQSGEAGPVTVGQVAHRYGIPETALAKVFQRLVRAGLAAGTRGVGGGYRLVKGPSEVTVLDVVSVFEPPRPPGHCLAQDLPGAPCDEFGGCRLRKLFDEVDEMARCTFASVTLDTLVGKRSAATDLRAV